MPSCPTPRRPVAAAVLAAAVVLAAAAFLTAAGPAAAQHVARAAAAQHVAHPTTAQAQPGATDEETLIALERGWNDAVYRRDADFVAGLLADDFLATYDDGSQGDRARELELIANFNQRVISATQEDFSVHLYGDTAVVRFTLQLVGLRQGQRAEVSYRYTDVWVRRDARWQCVSAHSTRIGRR